MKTIVENAQITFREQLASLKALTGMNNQQIADMIGCTEKTVRTMYKAPFTVSAEWILLVQEYLRKEERKRYGHD